MGRSCRFNFHLMQCPWNAAAIAQVIVEYEQALPVGAWPNWVLGNHDQPRIASRIGKAQARLAAMLLLTLRGTPTMYYGEEIGMTNVPIPAAEVQDPAEKNEPGKGQGRDPERTPMQWDETHQAGFTSGKPWLRLAEDWAQVNVAVLSQQGDSMLSLYRTLIALRNSHAALNSGAVEGVRSEGSILRYERTGSGERFAVVLNLGEVETDVAAGAGRIVVSTQMSRQDEVVGSTLKLLPFEGVVLRSK